MNKSERMNGIVLLLKERGRTTAPELSRYFEVSERTIYRDIDAISQLKIPIIAYEGLGGGYEIDDNYFMPSIRLTQDEVTVLLMVLKMGEAAKMPSLMGTYASLRSKLMNSLDHNRYTSIDDLMNRIQFFMSRIEPTAYKSGVFLTLLDALETNKRVKIKYYTPKANLYNDRETSLNSLFFEEGGWYVRGYCHLREESRTFRVDRIEAAEILEKDVSIPEILTSSNDRFKLSTYVLEMTHSLYRVIKDNDYMAGHKIIEDNDLYKIKVTTSLNNEIRSLILSQGEDIKLIWPLEAQEEIKEYVKKLYNKYNNPDI